MSDNQSVRSVPQIFVCDTTNPNAEQQLVTYELNHELNKGEVNDDAFTQCQDIQYMPLDKFVDQCNAIVFSPIKEECIEFWSIIFLLEQIALKVFQSSL